MFENEDGEAEKSIIVRAVKQLSASVVFPSAGDASSGENEAPMRSISLGQSIVLAPIIEGFSAPKYRWKIGGEEQAVEQFFSFTPTAEGEYEIEVEVYDQTLAASASVIVKCCAPEGTFRRAETATSSKKWSKKLRKDKFRGLGGCFFAITPFFKGLWYNNSAFDVVKTKNMCNFA